MLAASTQELRAAYDRAAHLRFLNYSFDRALNTPIVRQSLELSAAARRRRAPVEPQMALDLEDAQRGGL